MTKVLIVGGGGREHALAWKIADSSRCERLYLAPGNGGTSGFAQNVDLKATDIDGLVQFAETTRIDLTVVGSATPLAMGIVDVFRARGLRIFGPTRGAAQIEASKAFAKSLMQDVGVPTAPFRIFRDASAARKYIHERGAPIVVKASGLALGKGAYPCTTLTEAERALDDVMVRRVHGVAGDEVVIEDFLTGREISLHALSDGTDLVLFPAAQDHKRLCDGDQGPNTGGMGTIAPVPWVSETFLHQTHSELVLPLVEGLSIRQTPFVGCLYPGLMVTERGPSVLECNARWGDPETQVYVRLLKSDLLDIFEACVDGTLQNQRLEWLPGFAVCVVLASDLYPGAYRKGLSIRGITNAEQIPGVVVFHAGTTSNRGFRTAGGRVLGVTAVGSTLAEAIQRAYAAVDCINFAGMQFRRDIGASSLV